LTIRVAAQYLSSENRGLSTAEQQLGVKVRLKRLCWAGSCLDRPLIELKWSREERSYEVDDADCLQDEGRDPGREQEEPRRDFSEEYWTGSPLDSARALEMLACPIQSEASLDASTARLIDKSV
jgi:hypothetical protein